MIYLYSSIKWSLRANWPIAPELIPGFCSMKQLHVGVFLLPLDRILVHCMSLAHNVLGFPNNLLVPIYTPGWREALWELSVLSNNATQCPRPGIEPGPLDPESSSLTMRPPRLPPTKLRVQSPIVLLFLIPNIVLCTCLFSLFPGICLIPALQQLR